MLIKEAGEKSPSPMERHFQASFSSDFGLHQEIFKYLNKQQEIVHVMLKSVISMIRFFLCFNPWVAVSSPVLTAKLTVAVFIKP